MTQEYYYEIIYNYRLIVVVISFHQIRQNYLLQEQPEEIPEIKEGKETRKTTIVFDQQPGQQEPRVLEVCVHFKYNLCVCTAHNNLLMAEIKKT